MYFLVSRNNTQLFFELEESHYMFIHSRNNNQARYRIHLLPFKDCERRANLGFFFLTKWADVGFSLTVN